MYSVCTWNIFCYNDVSSLRERPGGFLIVWRNPSPSVRDEFLANWQPILASPAPTCPAPPPDPHPMVPLGNIGSNRSLQQPTNIAVQSPPPSMRGLSPWASLLGEVSGRAWGRPWRSSWNLLLVLCLTTRLAPVSYLHISDYQVMGYIWTDEKEWVIHASHYFWGGKGRRLLT